jgi:hypothetical protein
MNTMVGLEEDNARIIASSILNLRILVLALGELSEPPWWRSRYLSETGLRFLERIYPRSALSAAINSTGSAACRIHDIAIGKRGAFHIFRLPNNLEREVNHLLSSRDDSWIGISNLLGDAEKLKKRLLEISLPCNSYDWIGPHRIGAAEDALKAKSYQIMAASYFNAFEKGHQAFPYFEIKEKIP